MKKRPQTKRRRRIAVMGLGVLAAAALAVPSQAGAAKPTVAADATFDFAPCVVRASYEWSGFPPARAREAEVSIFSPSGSSVFQTVVPDANEGTINASSSAFSGGTGNYQVVGHLLDKKGRVIAQSNATDSVFASPVNCIN